MLPAPLYAPLARASSLESGFMPARSPSTRTSVLSHMHTHAHTPPPPRKSDNVQVVVRVRPLMQHEIAHGEESVIRVGPDRASLLAVTSRVGDRETHKQYVFTRVCGPDISQSEFFESSGIKALLDAAVSGINVSVFAYGQTGSGKTYSMSGLEEHLIARSFSAHDDAAGVIPRAVEYLFSQLAADGLGSRTIVRASFCELYNECVYDLLNLTGDSLSLRWNSSLGFFVQGQLVVQCDTIDDVMAVVTEGHKNRTVGSHALNLDSSRSHSLLTLMLERTTIDADTGESLTRRSKIVFVDLAGSERLKESKSEGLSALETRQINKSLFVLGKVIASLADKKAPSAPRSGSPHAGGRSSVVPRAVSPARGGGYGGAFGDDGGADTHVPYRDSKLTKLLMDSLGGNALTIMIACISPAAVFLEESLNTLQYAMRASRITNAPVVQVDTKDALIIALKKENKALREENTMLRHAVGATPDTPAEDLVAILASHSMSTMTPAPTFLTAVTPDVFAGPDGATPAARDTPSSAAQSDVTPVPPGAPPQRAGGAPPLQRGASRVIMPGRARRSQSGRIIVADTATPDGSEMIGAGDATYNLGSPKPGDLQFASAERAAHRAGRQSTIDAQASEIARLQIELDKSTTASESAKARVAALSTTTEEQRRVIDRLTKELADARRAQRHTELQADAMAAAAEETIRRVGAASPLPEHVGAASDHVVGHLQAQVAELQASLGALRDTNQVLELRLQALQKREMNLVMTVDNQTQQLRAASSMSAYSDSLPLQPPTPFAAAGGMAAAAATSEAPPAPTRLPSRDPAAGGRRGDAALSTIPGAPRSSGVQRGPSSRGRPAAGVLASAGSAAVSAGAAGATSPPGTGGDASRRVARSPIVVGRTSPRK